MNEKVIEILKQIGLFHRLKGDRGRSFAYMRAAQSIARLQVDVSRVDVEKLPGIGPKIGMRVREIARHGTCRKYESMRKWAPPGTLLEFEQLEGVDVDIALQLWKKYKIATLRGLGVAIEGGRVKDKRIIDSYNVLLKRRARLPLCWVAPIVRGIAEQLSKIGYVEEAVPVGEIRRGRSTVRDLQVLVCLQSSGDLHRFYEHVEKIGYRVDFSKVWRNVRIKGFERRVELVITTKKSMGAALNHYTGSRAWGIAFSSCAKMKGYQVNELGIWKGGMRVGGEQEKDFFDVLEIPWVPPECRETGNEIEKNFDKLISLNDIRGDLHVHTLETDGGMLMHDIAMEAKERGYEYIGISDHSEAYRFVHGLNEKRLLAQLKEARQVSKEIGIKIYLGVEAEIDEQGNVDLSPQCLDKVDYVIASVHRSVEKDLEERYLKALEHPSVRVLGHPTVRKFGLGYSGTVPNVNWNKVFSKASEKNVVLEINGSPNRLDLPDDLVRIAKEHGCRFVINSDSHGKMLGKLDWGVMIARRAGLVKGDVINTLKNPFRKR